MGLQLERGLELIFSKKLKQTITHLLPVFFSVPLLLVTFKLFLVALQFVQSNDTKFAQFG